MRARSTASLLNNSLQGQPKIYDCTFVELHTDAGAQTHVFILCYNMDLCALILSSLYEDFQFISELLFLI